MTRIGVLSDTHGTLLPQAYAALAECDLIFHAGDIGGPDILRELQTLAPVVAVLGNNDFAEYGEEVGRFAYPVVEGARFLMAHKPQDVSISPFGGGGIAPGDPLPQVIIHGHTHVPKLETGPEARPASLLLCPGSVTRPRSQFGKTLAFIEVDEGKITCTRIETLNGEVVYSATSHFSAS
jgi:hypothetical protein